MAGYYIAEGDSRTVETSLVNYCFSRFADSSSVLMRGDETLYSGVSVNPRTFLPLPENEYSMKIAEREIDGRNVLIAGSLVAVRNTSYAVYVVEDISTTYNSIVSLAWTFAAVSLAGILLGAGCIAVIMHRSTRPLTSLAKTARQIAGGDYSMRADVHTGDEIGALAGDFNLMAEAVETRIAELMETAERQRLFIGGVTHEFKTPLTALLLHSRMLRRANMTDEEKEIVHSWFLLTDKPVIYAANIADSDVGTDESQLPFVQAVRKIADAEGAQVFTVSAQIEEEIANMEPDEKAEFLEELGIGESGLDRLIHASYSLLGLISFLTAGEDECRAWTITRGTKAPQAAGKIHTDFERGFIRAEVVAFDDLRTLGSMNACKEKGLVRSEGKDYVMKDGDIVLFRFNV